MDFAHILVYLNDNQGFLSTIGIIIVSIGWIITFFLGLRQQKIQLRNSIKIKVYEELAGLKQELDQIFSIGLAVHVIMIDTVFINIDGAEKGIYSNPQLTKPEQYWQDYNTKLREKISSSNDLYLKFFNRVEVWLGLMPELENAKKILFKEYSDHGRELYNYYFYLIGHGIHNRQDWKEKVSMKSKQISGKVTQQINYLDDFMDLVGKELITPIFGKYIIRERNLRQVEKEIKIKVLTKKGIIEKTLKPDNKK